jgi:hypothetical protein
MSQVLKYGVPKKEQILCEAPGCAELATHIVKTGLAEHPTCGAHLAAVQTTMTMGSVLSHRVVKLNEPGEHNPVEAEPKK